MVRESETKKYADSHPAEFSAFLASEATRHFTDTAGPITILLLLCIAWNTVTGGTLAGLAWLLPAIYVQVGSMIAALLSQKGKWSSLRRYIPDGMLLLALIATFVLDLSFSWANKFSDNAPTIIVTLICSFISYHRLTGTIIRNSIFFALFASACWIWLADDPRYKVYVTHAFLGTFTGTCFSRLFTVAIEFRFMNEHTGQKIQRHLVGELAKLAFPHQIAAIQSGDALESTMPVAVSSSTVLVFDVQNSSKIVSAAFKKVLDRVISSCNDFITASYTNDRECLAYKLNEAYDGFICSIGFPFAVPKASQQLSHDQVAVALAFKFIEIFDETIRRECADERVYCAVGIAKGEIEGYYPHSGPKVYGMRGNSIILAARYEAYRKALSPDAPINANIILLQSSVWASLSPDVRQKFLKSELPLYYPIRNADGETEMFYYLSDNAEQAKIEQTYRTALERRRKVENAGALDQTEKRSLHLIDKSTAKKIS